MRYPKRRFLRRRNPSATHARKKVFGKAFCGAFGQDANLVLSSTDPGWDSVNCPICLNAREQMQDIVHASKTTTGRGLCGTFSQNTVLIQTPADEEWVLVNCRDCFNSKVQLPVEFRRNPGNWGVIKRGNQYLPYSEEWAVLFSDKFITNFNYSKKEATALAKEINKKRLKTRHYG